MKRSTWTLAIVIPALALMLFAQFVPSSGDEYAWLSRWMGNPAERESFQRWVATRDTVLSIGRELEQAEAVERAEAARKAVPGTSSASSTSSASRASRASATRESPAEALTIIVERRVGREARERITASVRQELAALGATSPLHPVTIILERDSTLRFHYRRTVVLPREAGAPCTVLVRERGRTASFAGIARDDRVLGTCAFFAKYGEPGRGMLAWLAGSRMRTAAYLASAAEVANWSDRPVGENPARVNAGSVSSYVAACRAGRPEGCLRQFDGDDSEDPTGFIFERTPWHKLDGVASYDPNSVQAGDDEEETSEGLLSALAAEMGPVAFARLWASDTNPITAYEAQTGEPLHQWVARRLDRLVTEYHAGPLPPMGKLMLLTLLITAIAGGTIGLARRRLS